MVVQPVQRLKVFLGSEGFRFPFLVKGKFIERVSSSSKEFILRFEQGL